MLRPTIDEYMMENAKLVATRSTCRRRSVGAVIVNADNHIISTGYNGTPSKTPHCSDVPCRGSMLPSGVGLDICMAIHAEVNAVAHCSDIKNAHTIYITTSPCMSCMKLLAATKITRIVAPEIYSREAVDYWIELNRIFDVFSSWNGE